MMSDRNFYDCFSSSSISPSPPEVSSAVEPRQQSNSTLCREAIRNLVSSAAAEKFKLDAKDVNDSIWRYESLRGARS